MDAPEIDYRAELPPHRQIAAWILARIESGDLQPGENGPPGRPTLKRRQPTPDDSTTPPDADQKSTDKQDSGPPKLKKVDAPTTKPPQP